jgi:Protein of unknown function (DUF1579)
MLLEVVASSEVKVAWASRGMTMASAAGPHDVLRDEEGTWDIEVESYPGGPPRLDETRKGNSGQEKSASASGVETHRLLAGGQWMVTDVRVDYPNWPFEGHGVYGYDPGKGRLVGTWVDSMSPYPIQLEGSYDQSTRTITMSGQGVDPVTGQPVQAREQLVQQDRNTRRQTMFRTGADGQEVKLLEIVLRRRRK